MIRLLLASSILGSITGIGISVLNEYMPLMIVYLVALLGGAIILAACLCGVAVWAKVPSTVALAIAGVIAGAFAFYVSWGTRLMFDLEAFDLGVYKPSTMMRYVRLMYKAAENGDGNMLSSTGLLALWAFEGTVFLAGVPFTAVATSKKTKTPFCETCRTWFKVEKGFLRLEIPEDDDQFASNLSEESSLWELPFGDVEDDPHLRLDLSGCKSCMQGNSVSLTLVDYQSGNDTLVDWSPISDLIARRLHERKPGYDEFIEELEIEADDESSE